MNKQPIFARMEQLEKRKNALSMELERREGIDMDIYNELELVQRELLAGHELLDSMRVNG